MVMKICISGLTASGKTTVSEALALKMKIKHVQNSYKEHLRGNVNMSGFIDAADEKFVKSFDMKTIEMASKEDCVVSTWLSPWLVKDADLRVWIYADIGTRIKRYMERETLASEQEAGKRVSETDDSAIASFKKFYNIDINEHSDFDLQINTGKISVESAVDIISLALKDKKK
jgi:cytidylate kinase